MELLQLRYFRVLARHRNLTKAAAELFVTPSSLSQTISRLERELETTLFDRIAGRLYLNERGVEFLHHVDEGLSTLDSGAGMFKTLTAKVDTCVSIAMTNSTVFNSMTSAFMLKYPDFTLSQRYYWGSEFENDDLLRQFDYLLSQSRAAEYENLVCLYLTREPSFWVVLPVSHRLASEKQVRMEQLTGERIIMPRQGFGLYERYMRTFAEAGFVPRIVAECDFTLRIQLVRDGVGITFNSKYSGLAAYAGNAVLRPIEGMTQTQPQAILWDRRRKLGRAAELFRDHAIDYFRCRDHDEV